MALTGFGFYLQLQEKFGHDYSAYYDPARANDIIKQAFYKCVEIKYPATDEETTDELYTLIKTGVAVTPTNNTVNLNTVLPDYIHLYAIENKFLIPIRANVVNATNATPIVLILDALTHLVDGSQISNSGFAGNTAANGEFYLKQLYNNFATRQFAYQLHTDKDLLTPAVGNGVYTGGGVTKEIILDKAKKKTSYRKISKFGQPTVNSSFFEIADGQLKILPLDKNCVQATIDYISKPSQFPDVTNNTFDLEAIFPFRFLDFWMDEANKLMAEYSRDVEGDKIASSEIMQP